MGAMTEDGRHAPALQWVMAEPSRTEMLVIAALAGCTAVDAPMSATESLTAAAGGVVALDDGATVNVPAGALAVDGPVTLTRETCGGAYASPAFAGCLYSVETPALAGRFAIAMPDHSDARNPIAVVRRGPDGLRPLIDSATFAGSVSATSSEPATFAIRVIVGNPTDDRCTDAPFEPCGGTIEGDWVLDRACGTSEQVTGVSWEGPDPYAACDPYDYVIDYPFSATGTVHFGGNASFSIGSAAVIRKHTIIATRCLGAVDETCASECERRAGLCDCTWDFAEGSSFAEAGGWAYGDAGTVTVDGTPFRYCVEGDTLTLEYANYQGPYTMIYTRQ